MCQGHPVTLSFHDFGFDLSACVGTLGGLGEVGQFARVRQARLKVDRHTVIDSKSVGDQPYWICDLCDVYCVLVFVFFCYTFQLFVVCLIQCVCTVCAGVSSTNHGQRGGSQLDIAAHRSDRQFGPEPASPAALWPFDANPFGTNEQHLCSVAQPGGHLQGFKAAYTCDFCCHRQNHESLSVPVLVDGSWHPNNALGLSGYQIICPDAWPNAWS